MRLAIGSCGIRAPAFEFRTAALLKKKGYAIIESVLKKGIFMNVFMYIFDTLADWEMSYLMAEINNGRYLKKNIENLPLRHGIIYQTNESKYFLN
jgi:hypothetical protein